MLCTVFTHSLFLYQKSYSFAALTRSISDTSTTRSHELFSIYPAFLCGREGYSSGLGFSFVVEIALCSLKRMPVLAEYHVIDFQQIPWLRGKIPLICCREQKAAFFQSVALTLWFCCLCEGSTIILVEMFSDMCRLEDNASRNCQTNTVARSAMAGCEKKTC